MRINTKNLNKKVDNPDPRPKLAVSEYPRSPIYVKRKSSLPVFLIVIIVLLFLIPVALFVVGMVSAVAIPSLLSSRKAANEASAIATL